MRRSFSVLSAGLTLLVLASSASAAEVRTVRLPHGGVQPQALTDSQGRTHVIYFKGDPQSGDVFYARLEGETFSPPVRVNTVDGSAVATGTVRGPHLAIGMGDRVHVAWMGSGAAQPRARGKATPMLYARMNEAGDGFEAERNVIRKAVGLDGGGSVAADGEGNVYVAWHAPPDGGHDEKNRTVWVARSKDEGATFESEQAAVKERTGVCACCGMRIGAMDGGHVFVLYRTATELVNRDIHLLVSDDEGDSFKVAADDRWKIGQCVMSTASFAKLPNAAGALAAWETKHQIRVAHLVPGSEETNPVTVPGRGENRKHPALAANAEGEVLVAWTEGTAWNRGGAVAWQRFDARLRPVAESEGRAAGLPAWGVPAVVANDDGGFTLIY